MANDEAIIGEAELKKEWERIYDLTHKQLKAELLELGVDESKLQACRRTFLQRLDEEIARSAPKPPYKM